MILFVFLDLQDMQTRKLKPLLSPNLSAISSKWWWVHNLQEVQCKKEKKQTNKNKSGIYIYLIKGTKSIPQENPQSWISEVKHKFICTTAHPLFLYYSYLSTSFQKETQQPLNIGLCIHHVPQQIFALWWNQRPQQEWNYSH